MLCTLRKLEEDALHQRAKLEASAKDKNPEGTALQDLCTQLKGRRITPEAFYRMCDINSSKKIPNETFAQCIRDFGIKMTELQIKRLLLLLDESFDNQIAYAEFCNALEAFDLDMEPHFSSKGGVKRKFKD